MDVPVGSAVVPVDVAELGRLYHRVVEGSVEDCPFVHVTGFDADFGKFPVPGSSGSLPGLLEIPAREFGGHVGLRSVNVNRRNRDFQHYLLAFGKVKIHPGVLPDVLHAFERLAELGIEEYFLVPGPSPGKSPALQGIIALGLNPGVRGLVPASSVLQIEHDGRGIGGRECISVESDPGCGRHLGQNIVAEQGNAVVIRLCNLPGPVGVRPESFPGILHAAGDRHHGNVEEVSDSGPLKMGVGESDHRGIAVVVAGAPVPLLWNAGRPELDKAERNAGAHENVSVAAASNLRINVTGIVLRRRA